MRSLVASAIFFGGLFAAAAQTHGSSPSTAESALPEQCRTGEMLQANDHATMDDRKLVDHQREGMKAMISMDRDMSAGMAQEDADVAFICGMIAHHQGAIAMSEIELRHGDDPAARAMAERIIAAQRPEIEEMINWVKENARR